MATLKSSLILSLVDKVSGPARTLSAALARNTAQLDSMRGQMLDSIGVMYAMTRGLAAPINAAIDFEAKMADVAKVVDFESPAAFKQMGDDIRQLSLRIPIAASGLAEIVAAGGQGGIANNELLKFTELAAKVGTAWEISAAEAGESMAKLKTALGRSVEDTASLADAINHLGNKSAASAPQILDVVKRVAPMAKQFGISAEQVAALGAAMTGSGFESEVAATSILNIGRALTRGAGATARQSAAFKRLGLSSKAVAASMQRDAMGTLQGVLERIAKLPADMRASLVSDLFGDEARALGPLISNGKLLGDTLDLVGDKTQYAGSAQAEFEIKSKTTANAMQTFKNRVSDLAMSVGNALLPELNRLLDKLGPVVTNISELAERYPKLTLAIVGTTYALYTFRAAITALRFAGLWMLGSTLAASLSAGGLAAALTAVGAALAAVSAPVWITIALAIAAVAAAGAWLYAKWDRVSAVLTGVGQAIGDQLEPVIKALQPTLDRMAPALDAIGNAAKWVGEQVSGLAGWFGKVFAVEEIGFNQSEAITNRARQMTNDIINAFIEGHAAIFQAGADLIMKLWEGMKTKFWEMVEWLKTIPQQIVSAVGTIDWAGTLGLSSIPGFGGGTTEQPAVDGAKANGGPVSGGKTYLVGERGPELFSPNRSGLIVPNHSLQGGGAGGGGATVYITASPTINVSGNGDPRAVAQAVAAAHGRAIKAAVESSFGGGGGF